VLVVATGLWLTSCYLWFSSISSTLQALLYFLGSSFFLRFAYNDGTILDPVLFGCHHVTPLPRMHPMGSMFNAQIRDRLDVDAGIGAAVALLRQPWARDGSSVCMVEGDGVATMKLELEVGMHAFALACLFRSEAFRRKDPSVTNVDVIETLSGDAQILHTRHCADPPMPKSDQVFVSAVRESPTEMIVAEWAVQHPSCPSVDKVVRHPFQVISLVPTGPFSTRITICVVTCVPSWMPQVLILDEVDKVVAEMSDLKDIATSQDGQELLNAVQKEVWTMASQEISPCLWDFIQSCAPGIARLAIVHQPRDGLVPVLPEPAFLQTRRLLDVLSTFDEGQGLDAAALAFNFASARTWTESRKVCGRKGRLSEITLWKHQTLSSAFRASCSIDGQVHPSLLALTLQSTDFKRQGDPSIIELREVRKVDDSCSVYYQRSHKPRPLHDRDSVYACMLVDLTPDQIWVLEWPVELQEIPVIPGVQRARALFLYEIRRGKSFFGVQELKLTLTTAMDIGGVLGSRVAQPIVDAGIASSLVSGLSELAGFFCTAQGRQVKKDAELQAVAELRNKVREELTSLQREFMEAHSEMFIPSREPQPRDGQPC